MTKKLLSLATLMLLTAATAGAQNITIKGVYENSRYDDRREQESEWIGSLYDEQGNYTGKTAYIVHQGIYALTWNGSELSAPEKDPAVNKSDIVQGSSVDYAKALWATNFNLMVGNSGAAHVGNKIVTVFSRDYQSTEDDVLFAVRKWDASTGNLLNAPDDYLPVSANIESAGMSYNPKDGKVYGLFHVTDYKLPDEILNDSTYSPDQDDTDWNREGVDDGYLIGTIDLKTMEMTPITPGLYYGNFVTFAINSEGRAFALTSGGTNGTEGEDGKIRDINNNLAGAQPIEFDLTTGLMIRNAEEVTDPETNETYTQYTYPYPATGYCSQVSRQAACFSKSNPNKMYWIGYYNSGKGINDWGSWGNLSDKDWKTNGKYDTALYELDLETKVCTRLAKVPNRMVFSCIWLEGDDPSEGVEMDIDAIQDVRFSSQDVGTQLFNLSGQQLKTLGQGLHIVKEGNNVRKVMMK